MTGYDETRCAFYRVPTKGVLARYLQSSKAKLLELSKGDFYEEWSKPKKGGGVRRIEAPRPDLKRVQTRIADLLQRVAPPDFLFSPVRGRSYVDNAAIHRGNRAFHTLDISDFYPNCTANRVAWYFGQRLQCAPDVTAQLVGLTTRKGRLPQGSPCSPILAYFSYVDMWMQIERLARDAGCTLSVYVDDLTISGELVPGEIVWQVRQTIRRFGHASHPKKERRIKDGPIEVTGVVVRDGALLLPNRQHKRLHEVKRELVSTKSPERRAVLGRQLRGREAQARQVLSKN